MDDDHKIDYSMIMLNIICVCIHITCSYFHYILVQKHYMQMWNKSMLSSWDANFIEHRWYIECDYKHTKWECVLTMSVMIHEISAFQKSIGKADALSYLSYMFYFYHTSDAQIWLTWNS